MHREYGVGRQRRLRGCGERVLYDRRIPFEPLTSHARSLILVRESLLREGRFMRRVYKLLLS